MTNTSIIGKKGEKLAVDYLLNKGYKILETNWRYKHLEIDIICKKDNLIIAVEVKARTNNFFGNPQEFVTKAKQKNILHAINAYLEGKNLQNEIRLDVIAITYSNQKIEHIENAFEA